MHSRRLVLCAIALTAAACALPTQDNPFDRTHAPTMKISVTLGGAPVASGERGQPLRIRVDADDPENDVITAVVTQTFEGDGTCAPSVDDPVGTVMIATGSTSFLWTQHPAVCFTPTSGDPRPSQKLLLHVRAEDGGGHIGVADTVFTLFDALPVADAGSTLWIDPTFAQTFTLSAARSFDPDGAFEGPLTYSWTTRSLGPVISGSGADVSVSLAAAGDSFDFELTVCDAWACGQPSSVEVITRRALWMRTNSGIALLDGRAGRSRFFINGSGAATVMPNSCNAAWVLPLFDGFGVYTGYEDTGTPQTDSRTVRKIGSDFKVRDILLGGGYDFIRPPLGAMPSEDIAWTRAYKGGTTKVVQVGPGLTISDVGVVDGTYQANAVAQYSSSTPLWVVSDDSFQTIVLTRIDGGVQTQFTIPDGSPNCLLGTRVVGASAAADGSIWFVTDGAAMHVDTQGAILSCKVFGTGRFPTAFAWTPGIDGTGELVVGFAVESPARVFRDPVTTPDFEAGPPVTMAVGALRWDEASQTLISGGPSGIYRWDLDSYLVPARSAPLPLGTCANVMSEDESGLAIDGLGVPWSLQNVDFFSPSDVERVPGTLSFLRANLPEAGAVPDGVSSVDPLSGRVWVREAVPFTTDFYAAAFDERGATPDPVNPALPWRVALPPFTKLLVFDPGTCTPGVSPCRAAGFWVAAAEDTGTATVQRVDMNGNVVATNQTICNGQHWPASTLAVEPSDGSVWARVPAASTCDTRFFIDGSQSVHLSAAASADYEQPDLKIKGVVDGAGNFWSLHSSYGVGTKTGRLSKRTLAGTQTLYPTGGEICGADPSEMAGSLTWDAAANQFIVGCFERSFNPDVPSYLTSILRFNSSGVQIGSIPASSLGVTTLIHDGGIVDEQSGALWLPLGNSTLLQLDRSLYVSDSKSPSSDFYLVGAIRN